MTKEFIGKNSKSFTEFFLLEGKLQVGEITQYPENLPGHDGVFIVGIDNMLAVYKPSSFEELISGWEKIEPGTYYKHERAAYLISRFLDLDIVPPTVIRDLGNKYGIGSVQLFIPNTKPLSEWSPYKKPDINQNQSKSRIEMMATLALFDILTHQTDRHSGNALCNEVKCIQKDGQLKYTEKLYAIDNGLSFGDLRLRNFSILTDRGNAGWLCGEEIPKKVRERFSMFLNSEESIQNLKKALEQEELLTKKESDALFIRIYWLKTIIYSKYFPLAAEVSRIFASHIPDM